MPELGQIEPAVQGIHKPLLVEVENVPARHKVAIPPLQEEPVGQVEHVEAPAEEYLWNLLLY